MKKVALFVFNGDPMCFIHVLLNILDMKEKGYECGVVVEGSAVKLIPEISKEGHMLNALYTKTKEAGLFYGACKACSAKLGVLKEIEALGMELVGDMKGHPSMSSYLEEGFEVITF